MTEAPTRCLNCGAALARGQRYCPECGRTTVPRRSNPWPWIVGGLVGLALVILLILLLRPPQSPPVTEGAPAVPKGPPVAEAPSGLPSGPPVAAANAPPSAPPAPEDPNRAAVAAYLERMAAIERRRKEIVNNLYPAMLTMAMLKGMGGMQDMLQMLDENLTEEQQTQKPASVEKAEDTMQQYRDQFRALALDVRKITPPVPAQRFHNGYLISLGAYDAVVGEIQNAMLAGDQSIAARGAELQGKVRNTLQATDAEMGRLLAQYRLMRTFSVSDDQQGGLVNTLP